MRPFASLSRATHGNYASIFAQRAFQLTDRLALHPESGRVVPEFRMRSLREILLGNYRIINRFIDDQVQVLTVYHGARLMEAEDLPNV